MKRSLVILFAILSLSIFFNLEKGYSTACDNSELTQIPVQQIDQSFSQGESYTDQNARRGGASSNLSTPKLITKGSASRRTLLDLYSGVRIALAAIYCECSYSYSCNFPFEHRPQRGLFFIMRNIRI